MWRTTPCDGHHREGSVHAHPPLRVTLDRSPGFSEPQLFSLSKVSMLTVTAKDTRLCWLPRGEARGGVGGGEDAERPGRRWLEGLPPVLELAFIYWLWFLKNVATFASRSTAADQKGGRVSQKAHRHPGLSPTHPSTHPLSPRTRSLHSP